MGQITITLDWWLAVLVWVVAVVHLVGALMNAYAGYLRRRLVLELADSVRKTRARLMEIVKDPAKSNAEGEEGTHL